MSHRPRPRLGSYRFMHEIALEVPEPVLFAEVGFLYIILYSFMMLGGDPCASDPGEGCEFMFIGMALPLRRCQSHRSHPRWVQFLHS